VARLHCTSEEVRSYGSAACVPAAVLAPTRGTSGRLVLSTYTGDDGDVQYGEGQRSNHRTRTGNLGRNRPAPQRNRPGPPQCHLR
jgi:hypothetical protein